MARSDASGMQPQPNGRWRGADYLALTKPGIVRMCLLMTAGGVWLASSTSKSSEIGWMLWLAVLLGSSLAVASANAFNMVWEREGDRLMERTRTRPLAAGRLGAVSSSVFAGVLGLASMLVLALGTNWLTTGLAAFALLSYVLIYTPLKRVTPLALVIGAVPGAVPPLLGWTAVTNSLDLPGAVLFGILLVWQMPHFLAISVFRKQDYAAAGIRCVPVVRGETVAKLQAIAWAAVLIPISLALTPLGVTGNIYFGVALLAGLAFLGFALVGLFVGSGRDGVGNQPVEREASPHGGRRPSTGGFQGREDNQPVEREASPHGGRRPSTGGFQGREENLRWARQLFALSLVYLPVVTIALVVDLLWGAS